MLQCPDNAGSSNYNYKGTHSIVLLAICDANYNILFVDIGAQGRRSDSGIFTLSKFGIKFESEEMDLPEPKTISIGNVPMPYCIVGDEAFPLKSYLQRPYPGRQLSRERRIYNYRLSRARRTIENVFGILASQWRILRRPIIAELTTAEKIVQAIVCLHNWLRRSDIGENIYVPPTMVDQVVGNEEQLGSWREIEQGGWAFQNITRMGANNSTKYAMHMREVFCRYFNNEGAVPWQYDIL